jgi:hypothetical protein
MVHQTSIRVILSFMGLGSGPLLISAFPAGRRTPRLNLVFLIMASGTGVTGFSFVSTASLPGIVVGLDSVAVSTLALSRLRRRVEDLHAVICERRVSQCSGAYRPSVRKTSSAPSRGANRNRVGGGSHAGSGYPLFASSGCHRSPAVPSTGSASTATGLNSHRYRFPRLQITVALLLHSLQQRHHEDKGPCGGTQKRISSRWR